MRTLRGGDGGGCEAGSERAVEGTLDPEMAHQPRLMRFWREEPKPEWPIEALQPPSRSPTSSRAAAARKGIGPAMSLRMSGAGH